MTSISAAELTVTVALASPSAQSELLCNVAAFVIVDASTRGAYEFGIAL